MRAAALVATCLWVSVAAADARQGVFRTGVELATFGVTLVDKKGKLVTDATRDEFDVYEDGKKQQVAYFVPGDGEGELSRLHVGLMLDASGSMEQDLRMARSAAIKFLNLVPQSEDITLVDFDTTVRVTRYPQRDFPRLVERIRQRKADGMTALYDALGVYLDGASDQQGRPILVVYTDGADSHSTMSYPDLLDLLKASGATVYAVGLLDNAGSTKLDLRMKLQQIAETTGGQAFFPSALKDLDASYARVVEEIKAQYHLGYSSTNVATDGAWRKVEIKVKRPGVKVRSRQGYFAPYKPSRQ